jgi:hypothetical protein
VFGEGLFRSSERGGIGRPPDVLGERTIVDGYSDCCCWDVMPSTPLLCAGTGVAANSMVACDCSGVGLRAGDGMRLKSGRFWGCGVGGCAGVPPDAGVELESGCVPLGVLFTVISED